MSTQALIAEIDRAVVELRQLDAAATPGPWESVGLGAVWQRPDNPIIEAFDNPDADAALIVGMRNALPMLLDYLQAQRGIIQQWPAPDGWRDREGDAMPEPAP